MSCKQQLELETRCLKAAHEVESGKTNDMLLARAQIQMLSCNGAKVELAHICREAINSLEESEDVSY